MKCEMDGCRLRMDFVMAICNRGTKKFYIDDFWTNSAQTLVSSSWRPMVVNPGKCETFNFSIYINDFSATMAEFVIYDSKNDCDKRFAVSLDWNECVKCCADFKSFKIGFIQNMSTLHEASYFSFKATLPPGTSDILSMWCDPPILMEYSYSPPATVKGLLLFHYSTLLQHKYDNLCIYAVVCIEGELCLLIHCIMVEELLYMITENPPTRSAYYEQENEEYPQESQPDASPLYLVPNPALNQVTVMGIDASMIKQITVITMDLKQVATCRNTHQFNIHDIASGIYIVRVIPQDDQTYYLKLVKQ